MKTSQYEYVYLFHDSYLDKETRRKSVIDLDDKDTRSVLDNAHKNNNEKILETDSMSTLKD